MPAAENIAACVETHISPVSKREVSTTHPFPVFERCAIAERIPIAVHMPVERSIIDTPTRAGGEFGSPLIDIKPAMACMIGSYPGRSFHGPLCPNAPRFA